VEQNVQAGAHALALCSNARCFASSSAAISESDKANMAHRCVVDGMRYRPLSDAGRQGQKPEAKGTDRLLRRTSKESSAGCVCGGDGEGIPETAWTFPFTIEHEGSIGFAGVERSGEVRRYTLLRRRLAQAAATLSPSCM
jgi:hypothetical protein